MRANILLVGALALTTLVSACDGAGDLLAPGAASPSQGQSGGGSAKSVDPSITFSIALVGGAGSYDAATGRTTFAYRVTSNPASQHAISHWVLGLSRAAFDALVSVSSGEAYAWSNPDPTTGLVGLKFDTGYGDRQTRTVTVVLSGNWSTVGKLPVAVKAGNAFNTGEVSGPGGTVAALVVPTYRISGVVYLDVNANGGQDAGEPGVPGAPVTLSTGASTVTGATGGYEFTSLPAGAYTVTEGGRSGLLPAGAVTRPVTITTADQTASFALRLDLAALAGQVAAGSSHGFWKSNIAKALKGQTNGVQVSRATLEAYLGAAGVSSFAIAPFNPSTLSSADAVLSATGSDPLVLLRKQLIASELNYFNRAYLGGDELLTRLFVWQGEYMAQNAAQFTTAQLLSIKDWFDAYNNTHGGALVAPATLP